MAKRKRDAVDSAAHAQAAKTRKEQPVVVQKEVVAASRKRDRGTPDGQVIEKSTTTTTALPATASPDNSTRTFQIITGSYERALHGFTAAVPRSLLAPDGYHDDPKVHFADTFLFHAHSSAIRCIALAPVSEESSKVTLATGSTDERVNLYSLSTAPPVPSKSKPQLPTLHGSSISENSKNKELGSLLHHSSSITALHFPTRSKLISSAEDSTIAITRARDWTPLSTIKAPVPKPQGRPSGDTAGPGEVPSGINDFAVHPSMKLMVSVGKGEKCMRLWNLVTGKKAGVLNFGKDILSSVGEGRFGSGEGRRVVWEKEGDEFAVAFERGVVVFGIDCKPKAKVLPAPRTKVHQLRYLHSDSHKSTLLLSTEDGRILLYDTNSPAASAESSEDGEIPPCSLIAQLGGPAAGLTGRIKDFVILPVPDIDDAYLVITGSSDGTVRLWVVNMEELKASAVPEKATGYAVKQIGQLIGSYSTNTRITCMAAFAMTGAVEAVEKEEESMAEKSEESSSDDDSE